MKYQSLKAELFLLLVGFLVFGTGDQAYSKEPDLKIVIVQTTGSKVISRPLAPEVDSGWVPLIWGVGSKVSKDRHSFGPVGGVALVCDGKCERWPIEKVKGLVWNGFTDLWRGSWTVELTDGSKHEGHTNLASFLWFLGKDKEGKEREISIDGNKNDEFWNSLVRMDFVRAQGLSPKENK